MTDLDDHLPSPATERGTNGAANASTTRYLKVRNELASGGSAHQNSEQPDRTTQIIGIGGWIATFVILAVLSRWMFVFAIGIVISIFLHEVGHYVTARKSGMKVTQFFIGFGPRIWSFHRDGIEYGLRSIPLGAFVRIIGMSNLDDDIDPQDEPRTYRAATYPRRMWVITAGSVMHMIIAVVLITGVYAIWGPVRDTDQVQVFSLVDELEDGSPSPAVVAGIQLDDIIVSIAGQPITTRDNVMEAIADQPIGSTFDIELLRDGQPLSVAVTSVSHPDPEDDKPRSYLGLGSGPIQYRDQLSFGDAVGQGSSDLVSGVGQSIVGVAKVINPVSVFGHLMGTNNDVESRPTTLVGATRFSDVVGEFDGWAGLVTLLAMLNVSVGVFNMFPLLPLDGGHAAIATYERLRSRRGRPYRADVAKLMPVLAVTIAVLAFMFITGLYLDIVDPIR